MDESCFEAVILKILNKLTTKLLNQSTSPIISFHVTCRDTVQKNNP